MRLSVGIALLVLLVIAPGMARGQVAYRLEWLGQDFYPRAINDRGIRGRGLVRR